MYEKPKVSIIIPAYNASKYLRESIDSAISQTYSNIEIIVVNDGSNDHGRTEKIAKSYGNKIKYYYKENGGVSTALNYGISKMTGEYFSWLSHDDKYYPEKVEKQIDYLKQNNLFNKNVILYSDYDLMNNHSEIFATSIKNHEELTEKPEYSLLTGAINGLSLLIPKLAFNELGLFDEKLRCTQDYELWKIFQKKYKFIHQPEILVTTRLHKEQQGNTSPYMLEEGNKFWINLIKDIPKNKREELEGNEYNFYTKMYNFLKTTPYKKTSEFILNEIKKIEKANSLKTKNIKVSVIIPFYNRQSKLIEAINSVLNQTHKNIELILVNDGSTEDISRVLEIIKSNKKCKYFSNETNMGAAYSRNIGIQEATGEYIAFLDSDDCFQENKIEIQLKTMYNTQSNFSHTSYLRKSNISEEIINSGKLNGKAVPKIIGSCGIATPTIMIKTDFLRKNNLKYNKEMKYGEDICFYLDALSKTNILGIDLPLSIVNINENSCAYNVDKQLIGLKTIIKYILNNNNLSKYDYEIGLLFKEFIRVCNLQNQNPIIFDLSESDDYRLSTSWRITKPLRIIKSILNLYKDKGFIYTSKFIIKKFLIKIKIIK